MDKVRAVELEERKLLERLLSLQREKSLLRDYGDGLFRRGVLDADAELAASAPLERQPVEPSSAPGFLAAQATGSPAVAASGSGPPQWSDADWAAFEFDPACLADLGSVGETAGASPGSSGAREVPTS
jgi:hypothetical protein